MVNVLMRVLALKHSSQVCKNQTPEDTAMQLFIGKAHI